VSERVAWSQHADDADEPVWRMPLVVGPGYVVAQVSRLIPVGRECIPPDRLRATEGQELERGADCNRGVYDPPSSRRQRTSGRPRSTSRAGRA
jgi:hypothetical protein